MMRDVSWLIESLDACPPLLPPHTQATSCSLETKTNKVCWVARQATSMPDKRSSSTDGDEERRNRNVFVGVLGTAQRAAKRKRHSSTSEPTTTAFLYKSSSSHPPMPAATEEDEAALMAACGRC